ncbi:hypothetical protein J3F83DRAFT_170387 [Trichoderma novae-zelandiae]
MGLQRLTPALHLLSMLHQTLPRLDQNPHSETPNHQSKRCFLLAPTKPPGCQQGVGTLNVLCTQQCLSVQSTTAAIADLHATVARHQLRSAKSDTKVQPPWSMTRQGKARRNKATRTKQTRCPPARMESYQLLRKSTARSTDSPGPEPMLISSSSSSSSPSDLLPAHLPLALLARASCMARGATRLDGEFHVSSGCHVTCWGIAIVSSVPPGRMGPRCYCYPVYH